jgi:hypothetical protein
MIEVDSRLLERPERESICRSYLGTPAAEYQIRQQDGGHAFSSQHHLGGTGPSFCRLSGAQPGLNRIEIKVTNEWTNRILGDQLLPPEKQILAGRAADTADVRLVGSGHHLSEND